VKDSSQDVLELIKRKICDLSRQQQRLTIAIDGRCASGKTTLALALKETLGCDCIHTDHFFLQEYQRTDERLREPGGNFDRERFAAEVLSPLKKGEPFSYRPYDCKTKSFVAPIAVAADKIVVIEGAYSLHPQISEAYDLKIFMSVNKEEQAHRLAQRNPAMIDQFLKRWIPLEEHYYTATDIVSRCDIVIDNDVSDCREI